MALERVEDTQLGITGNRDLLVYQKVSVSEFREFVNQTSYLTDCEKQGGGWIFEAGKEWTRKVDASWDNPYRRQKEQDPVGLVSWHDAALFANWKSAREGLTEAYQIGRTDDGWMVEWVHWADGYRLPTVEECKKVVAASATNLTIRDGLSKRKSSTDTGPNWIYERVSDGGTLEWCWDPQIAGAAERSDRCHSQAAARGHPQCLVAGGNDSPPLDCHGPCDPEIALCTLGFRLVRHASGEMPVIHELAS